MTDRDTETFVQEVEEGVRRERWNTFFQRYGWALGGVFGAIVLGVAGWEAWRWFDGSQASSSADKYVAAQMQAAQGDDAGALKAFTELSSSGAGAYRAAAVVERAARLEQAGDLDGARKAFDEATKMADEPSMKAAIALRAAYLAAETDALPAMQARLKPLIEAGGPYSYLARELLAAEAIEAGENGIAAEHFSAIRGALDAPPALQRRAASFLLVVQPTTGAAPTAATPASPAPAPPPAKPDSSGDKK